MYNIKMREAGADEWEFETTAQGVTYDRKKIINTKGRTMDGREHTSVTAIKSVITLTFNVDITPEFIKSLFDIFEHNYIEMYYPDVRTNTMQVKEFSLDEEQSTKIRAWNPNYKRFDAVTLVLEER